MERGLFYLPCGNRVDDMPPSFEGWYNPQQTAKSRWSVSMEGQLYDFGSCYLCWGNENDE